MFSDLNELKAKYQTIKQPGLDLLQVRYGDIEPLISSLPSIFQVSEVGRSYQDRPLNKVLVGKGPVRLFMWSQMHGDESTATASLFDLMNFISASENQDWVESWSTKLTLQMAPMINPDGAEISSRYNAQGIDLNRDAVTLQASEAKTLSALADDFKPHYGFNLHDQNRYYTTGDSHNTATISLLAPAFNKAKDVNESRHRAMQLAGLFNRELQQQIPGCVGRYDDTYSYRSFGDNFSARGIATILIESGHYPGDPCRQTARWLNFMMLIMAIDSIAANEVEENTLEDYESIPMNTSDGLVDIMLRNVNCQDHFTADYSNNCSREFDNPRIEEIGDLSHQEGLNNYDMSEYLLEPIKGYVLTDTLVLSEESYLELLRQGFSYFVGESDMLQNNANWPVIVMPQELALDIPVRQGQVHMIFSKAGQPVRALISDTWIEL